MEQENPTSDDAGASTLDRLESFLSADEAPQKQASSAPAEGEQPDAQEPPEADAQETTDEPAKADEPADVSEKPNEYQLSDLAKLLGADESAFDVEEDGTVMVKTKVDGQEGRAKFADVLKSYQLQSHVDKQVREVAEQRKAVQAQSEQLQQQMQVQQAIVGKVAEVKAIEADIARYRNIDWVALTDQDPAQAFKLDRQMRDLQDRRDQAIGEVNQAGQQFQEQQQQQTSATLAQERQALLAKLPEWSDPAKQTKEVAAIKADLQSRGYSESDIKQLTDHKTVLLARDAMLYRQQKAASSVTEKVVRAAPKIIKPGSSQPVNRQATDLQNLKTSVRSGKSGSVADYLLKAGIV